jgi:hypothetical protein
MWWYTLLRFGVFFALWGLLWLARVPGLLAAFIAVILSVPLSFVLLGRQRQRLADNVSQRVDAHRARERDRDARLSGDTPSEDDQDL